ncbi:MAG TPA: hypothetical protein VGD40_11385 [Chryseosolibacter sp.]
MEYQEAQTRLTFSVGYAGRETFTRPYDRAKPKKPNEIPQPGKNPETIPSEEPEPNVWPRKEPEIQPEREPLTVPPTAPPEIPAAPTS